MAARVARLQDLERIDVAGVHLRPVRRTLGISAFGTNAYSADTGELVVEPHSEGEGGDEELYVVVTGAAAFVVDGETIEAPAGTLVLVDPASEREARATADGTFVMAFGGQPGAAGPVSAWEWSFAAETHKQAGNWDAAYATAARALQDHPDCANTHFNLAGFAAQAGRADDAIEHLRRAVAADPKAVRWAAEEHDIDPIRDDPRFAAALRGA